MNFIRTYCAPNKDAEHTPYSINAVFLFIFLYADLSRNILFSFQETRDAVQDGTTKSSADELVRM